MVRRGTDQKDSEVAKRHEEDEGEAGEVSHLVASVNVRAAVAFFLAAASRLSSFLRNPRASAARSVVSCKDGCAGEDQARLADGCTDK